MMSPAPVDNTAKLTMLATAGVQLAAIISVLVIVLRFDGSTEVTVVQALLTFMVPNALAGGAAAVTHIATVNRSRLPTVPGAIVPTAGASAPVPVPVQPVAAPISPVIPVTPVTPVAGGVGTPASVILGS